MNLWAIDTPKEPSLPYLPNETNEEKKKDSKKETRTFTQSINVKLCDGREVSGTIELHKEELTLVHNKDGINYEKKIELSNLTSITILSWEGRKGKKNKEGTTYQFMPLDIVIKEKTGDTFHIQTLKETEFLALSLKNRNGIARLFAFWVDLQMESGKWFSKIPTNKNNQREECHPDVWKQIKFY
ncbi:MAG: hypothetical protein SFU98_12485 [Leptospiraceae bacterium]|nr:hypothetical protein [Leptospiraceae bacterium]